MRTGSSCHSYVHTEKTAEKSRGGDVASRKGTRQLSDWALQVVHLKGLQRVQDVHPAHDLAHDRVHLRVSNKGPSTLGVEST